MIFINRRVVITGLGALSPSGNNINDTWSNIKIGKNAIDYIKSIDTEGLIVKIAAELKDFDPLNFISKKDSKRLDKFSIYAIIAADEAVEDSGIKGNIDAEKFGVIFGTGMGGVTTLDEQISKATLKGPDRISPLFIPTAIANMAAGNIAIKHGAKGINFCVVTACATGTHSIGEAFRNIKHGYIDACITGGSEAAINRVSIAGFTNIQALTREHDINKASIPFDKNRSGFVIGEGAGALILEELEHAKKRNAKIYGEIVGYGATCDAFHITSPEENGSGAKKAMELAIKEAGIEKEMISYINAHGTSTQPNDIVETNAIKELFKEHAYKLSVSSTKSMTGHLLGAAGAIESIITVMALYNNFIPPTINTTTLEEGLDLDYVLGKGKEKNFTYALSNSFGFGGQNGVLCIKKWEG